MQIHKFPSSPSKPNIKQSPSHHQLASKYISLTPNALLKIITSVKIHSLHPISKFITGDIISHNIKQMPSQPKSHLFLLSNCNSGIQLILKIWKQRNIGRNGFRAIYKMRLWKNLGKLWTFLKYFDDWRYRVYDLRDVWKLIVFMVDLKHYWLI